MSEDHNKNVGVPKSLMPSEPIVVSRDRFDTIPVRRQRYIFLYLAMMAMWVATTVVGVRTQARNEEAAAAAAAEAIADEVGPENENVADAPVEETAPGTETAVAPAKKDLVSPGAGDFTQTTKTLLEQRPILYLQVATGACMALFYFNFIGVLRTMGYSAILILVICFGCFFPLPGLLVLAMVDRRVSKVWHDANPEPV